METGAEWRRRRRTGCGVQAMARKGPVDAWWGMLVLWWGRPEGKCGSSHRLRAFSRGWVLPAVWRFTPEFIVEEICIEAGRWPHLKLLQHAVSVDL